MTVPYDFDTLPERRGTNSSKWDGMERLYGVSPADGLAMWVADMDFETAPPVRAALKAAAEHGVFGYEADHSAYLAAICDWQATRHGWRPEPEAIFTTSGLVNAISLCLDIYTDPGDGVLVTTPVYHAFHRAIERNGRRVVECPLSVDTAGRQSLEPEAWAPLVSGRERMILLCSPHNPGGRVWSTAELQALAEFAARQDLLIVADEVHADLTMPGHRHIPFPLAAPEALERTILLTAASKTFNIAAAYTGQAVIPDLRLRAAFAARMRAMCQAPNAIGMEMTRAAYTDDGAAWLGALTAYLDDNRRLFESGVAAIPGLRVAPLEATYLSWVDFTGTGMDDAAIQARVWGDAKIAANPGPSFGAAGQGFLRFNLGTSQANVAEAVERLTRAFADLQ